MNAASWESEIRPYLSASASGILLLLSFPPFFLWPLAWIAWIPLYRAIAKCRDARSAANLGGVAGLVFYGASLWWLVRLFGPLAICFWCIFALGTALQAFLLWRCADVRRPQAFRPELWIFAAAVTATGIEYFRAEVWWLHCSWLSLGYSQTCAPRVLQSCALLGVYGLSGLIAAFNAAASLAPERPRQLAAAALIAVAVAGWGSVRMKGPREEGAPLAASAIQSEDANVESLVRLSAAPEARGSRLFVWPEYGFNVIAGKEDEHRRLLAKKLAPLHAVTVAAAGAFSEEKEDARYENFAWVLSPEGTLLGRYDKMHPIPYVEHGLQANRAPRPIDTPLGRIGVLICYDLDFQDGARELVRQGARLLAVPNMDPVEWPRWQHLQHSWMTPARAVETGLWIVRAASSGISQIVDPTGRVRASLDSEAPGVVRGNVFFRAPGTPFTTIGWMVGPSCLVMTLSACLVLLLRALKR